MPRINRISAVALCAFMSCTTFARTTITFDELAFQPVHGLSLQGVTFEYQLGGLVSDAAQFASFGPGQLTNISDPSLTGPSAGTLTLAFANPTTLLEFGVALSTADDLTPGFTVELFDTSMNSLGETTWKTFGSDELGFSETRFIHEGEAISRAVIGFSDTPVGFALDNLSFVPEPGGFAAFVTGLVLATAIRRRRS